MRDRVGRLSHIGEVSFASGTEKDRRSATTHPTGAETFVWEGLIEPTQQKTLQTGDFRDRYLIVHGNLLRKDFYDAPPSGLDALPGPPGPSNASHKLYLYDGPDTQNSVICRGELFYTSLGWDLTVPAPTPYQVFQKLPTRGGAASELRLYANFSTGAIELYNPGGQTFSGVLIVTALPQLNALVPIP